jgi:hypothetical protein
VNSYDVGDLLGRTVSLYRQHCGRFRAGAVLVIIVIFGAGVSGTAHAATASISNGSGTRLPPQADRCSSAQLSVSQDSGVEAPTQNDMLLVALANRFSTSCWLEGYPRLAFRDKSANILPFDYRYGGDRYLWVTRHSPSVVHLAPGADAYLLIDKTPCNSTSDQAASLRITPPGNTKSISLTWSEPFIGYCGRSDLGHVVALSPIESSAGAVYGTT